MEKQNKQYFTKKNSKLLFVILSLAILLLAIVIASPYMNAIILSIIVAYIVQPLYKFLTKKLHTKTVSASILSTALIILFTLILGVILVIAIINIASIVQSQVNNLKLDNNSTTQYIQTAIDWINTKAQNLNLPIEITLDEIISNIKSSISGLLNGILSAASSISSFSVSAFFNMLIFYGLTFVIVPKFDEILSFIKKIIPFEEEITTLYINRTLETAKAMVWGMFIVALAQSLVAGVILYILGTPYTLLIMLLIALFSFLPLLGTGMIVLPVAGIYILSGQLWKGIILTIFQILVIGNIDTILRAKLIPKDVRMSIFVSFVAIFGGLSIWGIWGLIYGPVIFILLLTTIEVIKNYYLPSRKEK